MKKKSFAIMLLSFLILTVYSEVSWATKVSCWNCGGTGKQNCGICRGSGTCPTCNGKRRYYIPGYGVSPGSYVNCQGCYGDGKCWRCNGDRKETCYVCGGSKTIYVDDPTPVDPNTPPSPNKTTLKNGTPSTEYYDEISSSSGKSPYTWEITSGTLPTGINFASSGDKAVFYGTLTDKEGDYTFTLKVTDANGKTDEKQITFKVSYPPLTISGWIPGDGSVGSEYCKPYGARFSADDGTEPYTWKISRGLIPPGMKLNTEGNGINGIRITGSPTSPDTYNFTLSVVDGKGRTAEKDLTLKVKGDRVNEDMYIDGELPDVTLETVLSQYWKYDYYLEYIYVKGGRKNYTWSVIAGELPQGLSIQDGYSWETEKCKIGGWPDGDNSYKDNEFILQVVDADGRTATKKFSINVPDGLAGGSTNVKMPYTLPEISGTLSDAAEGKTYSSYVTASGGTAPYTWSADISNLPEGFKLACSDNTTGNASGLKGKYAKITGTPSYGGRYGDITLKVTDANGNTAAKSFIFKVVQKPTISGTLEGATRRSNYAGKVKGYGGTLPYTWSVSTGALPDGLTVKASGDFGVISGTPTKAGKYSFTLKVADKNGLTASKAMEMDITQTTITGTLAGSVTRKGSYSGTVKAEGGVSPYVWSVSEGKLPEGLKLEASGDKADITGTATKAGTFKFTVKAKDKNGAASTKEYSVKVTQTAVTGDISASTTRKATYTGSPKASGGTSPYTWSISDGKLPDGLKINSSTGKITGNATKAGTFKFTVKAKDKNGAASTKEYSVKVTQTAVTGDISASTTRKATYTGSPKVSGGASPYTWSISAGKLPDGLKINASNGKITGTPAKAGTFKFTVKAKDKNGAAGTKAYTVKVTQTAVTGYISASTTRKASYTGTPKATGGASPYTWSISAGKLPDGLKINSSNGKITGTPTKAGTFKFTVKAKDKNGAASTKEYSVKVTQTAVTGDISASTTRKASYTGSPKVSGGASPYKWSISAGKLPDGLKINSSNGKITGTPTKAGTFNFTVKAKDKNGAAGTKAYTVKVTQSTVSGNLANATKGSSYTATPKATGGASPYAWTISAGSLPNGLKLNTSTGKITGTPSKTGIFNFTVKAKDKNGAAGTKAYTVKVTQATSKSVAKSVTDKSALPENLPSAKTITPPTKYFATSTAEHENNATHSTIFSTSLQVVSEDVISAGTDSDSGLIEVKADMPLRLIIGQWVYPDGSKAEVSDVCVWLNFEPDGDIAISDEGSFTIPAEAVHGGICVSVKAKAGNTTLETEELYITAE